MTFSSTRWSSVPATSGCERCRVPIPWLRFPSAPDSMSPRFRPRVRCFVRVGILPRNRFDMGVVRFLLTACLVAFGACASFAAPAPPENLGLDSTPVIAPQWRVDSTWEYSDGYGLRVASTTQSTTVFQRLDAPDQWFSMRGFLRQDAASATTKRQTIYRTVAPTAGDGLTAGTPLTFQREYLSNKQLIVHASSWAVEGRQRITVPAGTFDCWVIVWRARSLKSNWTGFERWWYSPEVQQYVRLEYKYGAGATASRVLMRYHLPGPGETSPVSVGPTAAKSGSSTERDQD